MATCMNGLTRLSLSLVETFRIYRPVKRPETPSGKRRPCGTLLQLVIVVVRRMPSISRSVEVVISVAMEQSCNTTHFLYNFLLFMGTVTGGQFDWGGALSKMYR